MENIGSPANSTAGVALRDARVALTSRRFVRATTVNYLRSLADGILDMFVHNAHRVEMKSSYMHDCGKPKPIAISGITLEGTAVECQLIDQPTVGVGRLGHVQLRSTVVFLKRVTSTRQPQ